MQRIAQAGLAVALLAGGAITEPALADSPAAAARGTQIVVDSTVEAGYSATFDHRGSPLTVGATITVPRLECGSTDTAVATSVGVVEVPYRYAVGRVVAQCGDGSPTYRALLASSTGQSEEVEGEVGAGDRITIAATWDGSVGQPEVVVTMKNRDQGWQADATFTFVADGFNGAVFRQTPVWAGGAALPVAEYTGARVSRARVDGRRLGERAHSKSVLVDGDGVRVVVPTKIKNGERFTFTRVG